MKEEIFKQDPWWYNEESKAVLNRGYLLHGETIQDALDRITSSFVTRLNRPDLKEKFYEMIHKGWISLSSPIWSNTGTRRGYPISCYGVSSEDSIEGITYKLGEVMMQTKHGGGTSGYFGNLRGRGAAITNNGSSSGSVSFMKMFDTAMSVVSQGCYADDVEILTEDGFKLFKDLDKNEKVAQVLNDCTIEFVKPTEYFKYKVKEDLIRFHDPDYIDIRVTKNHNMVFNKYKSGYELNLQLKPAEDLKMSNDVVFYTTFPIKSDSDRLDVLSTKEKIDILGSLRICEIEYIDGMLYLFNYSDRLRDYLKAIGIEFYEDTDRVLRFLWEHRPPMNLSWLDVKSKPYSWCKSFIDFLYAIDYHNGKTLRFESNILKKEEADKLCHIATLVGMNTKTDRYTYGLGSTYEYRYKVLINEKARFRTYTTSKTNTPYEGYVYCVEVPTNKIIVRSNGHTLVCGNSTRRGSFAAYLDIDHPDIEEFLTIKDIGSDIQNLFYGVCVPDYWMQEMIDGDTDKRKLWAKILESRQFKGLPYILFSDNVNRNKPDIYKHLGLKISHSNLCVAPYTKILTSKGYIPIGDLENEEVEVWNGEAFSKTIVKKTGENKQLLRVTTDSGYELDCTPHHKFYIQRGYYRGTGANKYEILEKRAYELQPGDKLIKFSLPIIEGEEDLEYPYENGFYSGDGCLDKSGAKIYLYGEKRNLKHRFPTSTKWYAQEEFDREITIMKGLKDKFFVPDSQYTIKSRLDWLSGYLDADGTVTNNNDSQSIQAASINKEFLLEIQLMLQTLGCDSKVVFARELGRYLLPKNDGSGDLGYYNCNAVWRLLINGNSLYKLIQLGLNCSRLKWDLHTPNRECSRFIKVAKVETLPDLSDTFCFTEPIRHMGMFNGILTGQCSEIALPNSQNESFVCCLLSLNLELYDEWKDTDTIKYAIYILDAVMSEFIEKTDGVFGFKPANAFAKRHRALGLGVLGWHSLLQRRGIPFEDFRANALTSEIFSLIKNKSEEASLELAELYGPAPIFNEEGYEGKKYRNATLMAIAPTTSSSSILGQVSPGIEPFSSNYYKAALAKGNFIRKNKYLEKVLEKYGKNTEDTWRDIMLAQGSVQHLEFLSQEEKDVFKTFKEISQHSIIVQASIRQKYVDQSQSLNLNIPHDVPLKEVNALIIEAWKLGIKTLYYQRSQSVSKEMLSNIVSCKACEA